MKAIALGAAENVAMDVAAQVFQLVNGHRKNWDWRLTATAAEDGAVFGAVAGGVHFGAARYAPGPADSWSGHLLSGIVTGGAGTGATSLAHGQPLSGTDFLKSLTAGLVEGGAERGTHGDLAGRFDLDLSGGNDLLPEFDPAAHDGRAPTGGTNPLADHVERVLGDTPPDPGIARESQMDGPEPTGASDATTRVELVGGHPADGTEPSHGRPGPVPPPVTGNLGTHVHPGTGALGEPAYSGAGGLGSPAHPGANGPAGVAPPPSSGPAAGPAAPPASTGTSAAAPGPGRTHVDPVGTEPGRPAGGDRATAVGPGRVDPPAPVGAGMSALAPTAPADQRAHPAVSVAVTPLFAGGGRHALTDAVARSGEGGPERPRSWADGFDRVPREEASKPADEVRQHRAEARSRLDQLAESRRTIEDLVREAPSLDHLLDSGVRPDEIASHLDEATLARLVPGLDPVKIPGLHQFFGDDRVPDALRRSWPESARGDSQILAETLLRGLLDGLDLVDVMRSSEVLMDSLTQRPSTIDSLIRHPQAIAVLTEVVNDIHERGVDAVLDRGVPPGEPTPLADWQRELSESITVDRQDALQPGFDLRRTKERAYVEAYLRDLYQDAAVAQQELVTIADEIASATGGEARYRKEPKRWQRALDKIAEHGWDASQLTDLAAGNVEYRTLPDLYDGLREITGRSDVTITSYDDRFLAPQDSGYRDIQMTLRMPNGYVVELRLHLQALEKVANWEHVLYEVRRDVKAIAVADGRDLTDQERAIRDRLLTDAQRYFWDAMQGLVTERGST
jgi:hypothetical protein